MLATDLIKLIETEIEQHEKIRYFDGQDYLGPLDFYAAVYDRTGTFKGYSRNLVIHPGEMGLGPTIEAKETLEYDRN